MVIGARRSSFPLSPQAQLQAFVSYDPITRRKVRFIETIVPTLSIDSDVPADIYYADPGSGLVPEWISTVNGVQTGLWDATEKRFYTEANSTSEYVVGGERVAWPTGPCGNAQSFEPKNGEVTKLKFEFRARFNANADYGVTGIGLLSSTTSSQRSFSNTGDHFIQVTRNSGNWEMGTCDGSTISQSASSGGADGAWHDFRVEWETAEARLYVDDVLAITKTTNLPAQALAFRADCNSGTNTFDMMGVKLSWA